DIQTDRRITGYRNEFMSKALARSQCELDVIVERLGLATIQGMMSMTEDEARDLLQLGPDAPPEYYRTDWYDHAAGKRTIHALQDYFAKHPDELLKLPHREYILQGLQGAAEVLAAARKAKVRFYFHMVF